MPYLTRILMILRAWLLVGFFLADPPALFANNTVHTTYKNHLGMEFVLIPAGTFWMGSPPSEPDRNEDETFHRVKISSDFYMQTTEVTRQQWKALMLGDPSSFKHCGDQCPVHRVQWDWVMMFIKKLNQVNPKYRYRLPTEAQWEYAARAGSQAPFGYGRCVTQRHGVLDFRDTLPLCVPGDAALGPLPVASLEPNAWGLYDMHGNVWEWVSDWYGPYPTSDLAKAVVNPTGPEEGNFRIIRGGSWKYPAVFARSANRKIAKRPIAGFRLVLEINDTQ